MDRREAPAPAHGPIRLVYLGIGWTFFGLGVLGAFLPVLPTTPLMILALWGFSKSSVRLHHWLYGHRVFGPSLHLWHDYRVIPASAKIASLAGMTASLGYLVFFTSASWLVLVPTAALMAYGAWYIFTKPSRAPGAEPGDDPGLM